ncbi:hypothetical protein [Sphingomonas lenta]|uniref:Uncharacterized protein n=1 Tax=Sphingomonas lenta TaxID=1141887 RepID=A0A2A2SGS0_9SPHN|nr:hypothetical protein [Sphingomonas lenta]PAX08221.1 hypothetical protein CKY28_11680 [Sphingomonas lenta]
MADENLEDIQPKMDRDTTPRLDVSKEPQTMSMQHRDGGDARLDKDERQPTADEEAGNKTSLLWNE